MHVLLDEPGRPAIRQAYIVKTYPEGSDPLKLVPSLWQSPDYIEAGGEKDTIVLCLETFDGGILKLPVGLGNKNTPYGTGLFKERKIRRGQQSVFHDFPHGR